MPTTLRRLFAEPKSTPREIPSETYDRDFFLSHHLEGFEEFKAGRLSYIKAKQVQMLDLRPGQRLLEVGFGRGELLLHCAREGAKVSGVDYAHEALAVARETLAEVPDADVRVADARKLPFETGSFDRVFSGDVIEHMSFDDALAMLKEMYRVTRPGGFLLVKTTPNTVFVRWVYPWAKHIFRLIDQGSVALMDEQLALMRQVHVDEYSLPTLKQIARKAGMPHAKCWIDPDITRSNQHRYAPTSFRHSVVIKVIALLGRFWPVRFFLGNDLYLKCEKR